MRVPSTRTHLLVAVALNTFLVSLTPLKPVLAFLPPGALEWHMHNRWLALLQAPHILVCLLVGVLNYLFGFLAGRGFMDGRPPWLQVMVFWVATLPVSYFYARAGSRLWRRVRRPESN